MDCFNKYWQSKMVELRPTAGYPVDAKRFVHDLTAAKIWEADRGLPSLEVMWRRA
jgi:hypothetical protein